MKGRGTPRALFRAALCLVAVFAGACGHPGAPEPVPPGPGVVPDFPAVGGPAKSDALYRLDPGASELRLLVYRGGPLARFGHDHVIHHVAMAGMIRVPPAWTGARADIVIPVAEFIVDERVRRAEAGFDTQPTDADIAGTRSNMLGPHVLDANRFPFVRIRVEGVSGELPHVEAMLAIIVGATTARKAVSAEVALSACELRVSAAFSLRQSELGLTPFSVLGGALQVAEQFDVSMHMRAGRVDGPDTCGNPQATATSSASTTPMPQ